MRQVVLRLDWNVQFMLHVPNYAYDLQPRCSLEWSIEANALADGVFTRPVFARQCFVDNDDRCHARFVLIGEAATANERNPHGAEVIRRRDAITTVILLSRRGLGYTFN